VKTASIRQIKRWLLGLAGAVTGQQWFLNIHSEKPRATLLDSFGENEMFACF